jgi:hypothetical protein
VPLPIHPGAKPPPTFDDPIGALYACHRRIEAHAAIFVRIADALRDPARLGEAQEALAGPLHYFETAGKLHSLDEDGSLFPRLHDVPALGELEIEHRAHEAIFLALADCAAQIRAATPAAPPAKDVVDAFASHAAALASAYADHIAREEREVFPLGAALPAAELRAIGLEMRLRRGS